MYHKVFGKVYKTINDVIKDKGVNKYNLSKSTVEKRLQTGMSLEEAISFKRRNGRVFTLYGKEYTGIEELLKDEKVNKHKLSSSTMFYRLSCGMTLEQAITTPKFSRVVEEDVSVEDFIY